MQSEARLRGLQNCGLVQTAVSRKGGRLNETNYPYSIISPPPHILVAKPNQQKGGVISSEYGTSNKMWGT